ncbi:hypothetical protein [Parasitella parasitica]|uniref:Uncharacterized protein n=1 Tax=Parasitella parasitica TaxID=35722 RepID=A0A0B7N1C4_9FUNG|nr:hypothetical protein [Parasitella parasitica]CEP15984.1 hypothetical protein [Parasitella parasitica]
MENTKTQQEYKYFVGIDFGPETTSCHYVINDNKFKKIEKNRGDIGFWPGQSVLTHEIASAIGYTDSTKPNMYIGGRVFTYPEVVGNLPNKLDSPEGRKSCADFFKTYNDHVLERINRKLKEMEHFREDLNYEAATIDNIQYCFLLQSAHYKENLLEALKQAGIHRDEDPEDKIVIVDKHLAMAKKVSRQGGIKNNSIICDIGSDFTRIRSVEITRKQHLDVRASSDWITFNNLGDEKIDQVAKDLAMEDMKKQGLDTHEKSDFILENAMEYFRKNMKYTIQFQDLEKEHFARVVLPEEKKSIYISFPRKDLKEKAYDPLFNEIIESVAKFYESESAVHVFLSGRLSKLGYWRPKMLKKFSERLEQDAQDGVNKELSEELQQVIERTLNQNLDDLRECSVQSLHSRTKEYKRECIVNKKYNELLGDFDKLIDSRWFLKPALKSELDKVLKEIQLEKDVSLVQLREGLRQKSHSLDECLKANVETKLNNLDLQEILQDFKKNNIDEILREITEEMFYEQFDKFKTPQLLKESDAVFNQKFEELEQNSSEMMKLQNGDAKKRLTKDRLIGILLDKEWRNLRDELNKEEREEMESRRQKIAQKENEEYLNRLHQKKSKEDLRQEWEKFYKIRLACIPSKSWRQELREAETDFQEELQKMEEGLEDTFEEESKEELSKRLEDFNGEFNQQFSTLKKAFTLKFDSLERKMRALINEKERARVQNEDFNCNKIIWSLDYGMLPAKVAADFLIPDF